MFNILTGGFCLFVGLLPWEAEAPWHHLMDAALLAMAAMNFAWGIAYARRLPE